MRSNMGESFHWWVLFLATFTIHFGISLLFFLGVQPIRVGDEQFYHRNAAIIAERIRQGDLSFKDDGVVLNSWYTILLGGWYALGGTHPLWGGALSALLAAAASLFLFSLLREFGGSARTALLSALFGANAYPSYLYFGSLTLRDTAIVPLVLAGFFVVMRFFAKPSWKLSALIFLNTVFLFGIKGEVALIFMLSLFLGAFLVRSDHRHVLAGAAFLMLIFIPLFFGWGIAGLEWAAHALKPERLVQHREAFYSLRTPQSAAIGVRFDLAEGISARNVLGYAYSFLSAALGPFPWQMRRLAHWFALTEVIPWYVALGFIWRSLKANWEGDRKAMPFLFFALFLVAGIALVSDNLGADMRYRMPAFLALLATCTFKRRGA